MLYLYLFSNDQEDEQAISTCEDKYGTAKQVQMTTSIRPTLA